MRCPSCGVENAESKRFCKGCGSPLAPACASCGSALEEDSRFCGECGAPVAATGAGGAGAGRPAVPAVPAAVGAPAASAEVRHVSVLFCDLVGYTTLSESRDPEEVRALLSGYFDLARAIIGRYGGIVEKFIGDAVMAVWGAPVANEDDAERAVRAGLELVSTVPAHGASAGVDLACRVGVASGPAATTESESEGLVVGDRVNTASRIQSAAPAGACFVDQVTKRLSDASIAYEAEGPHELKGKSEPEQLYRATRVLSGVGGRLRSGALEAPLVGRDAELRTLKDLFHASAERRSPRLVAVSGPAGVGKSRLGFEFERYVDGLVDTVLWHRGHCLSYGEGVSFWALSEMVRQRLGIAEDETNEATRAKLSEGLVRLVGRDDSDYVGARLARLLGVELEADNQHNLLREELFAGWRLFFEHLAQVAPVVLLVEDAQHADVDLLGFLDHLVDWTRNLPIFVLVLARPELFERRAGFGVGRNRSMLSLDPLDRASMDDLIEALVLEMPIEPRRAVTDRAEGIPLFAVETVRSLIDSGSVVASGGGYRLAGELGELSVPDSLHALLASRLDALDPPTRGLLAVASVLGSSFPEDALVVVSGRGAGEVRAGLSELVRRNVLEITANPLSPRRGDYRFAQEMLRQVAYETLSRKDRKAHHLAVASCLRKSFPNDGEEMAEVIARHYQDALSAGPEDADAPGIREEAISMLVRAAERSKRAGAPAQGAISYSTAAELLVAPHVEAPDGNIPADARDECSRGAELYEEAARAALTAASYERALAGAAVARRIYVSLAKERDAARTRVFTALTLYRSGRLTEARSQLTNALDVLRDPPDSDTVDALHRLATVDIFAGSPEGERRSEEALLLGQEVGADESSLANLLTTRGIALFFVNRRAEALAFVGEGVRLAKLAGDAESHSRALLNLAEALRTTDAAASLAAAKIAAEEARRVGGKDYLAVASGNTIAALLDLGEWDEAEEVLATAEEEGVGDHPTVVFNRVVLVGLRGDAEMAEAACSLLAEEIGRSEDRQDVAALNCSKAFAAWARCREAEALERGLAALHEAGAVGIHHEAVYWSWPLAARAARRLCDSAACAELVSLLDTHRPGHLPPLLRAERLLLGAHSAEPSEAGDAFAGAVEALRKAGSPYHLAHGLLDHAQVLARTGDMAHTAATVKEAGAIGERLRCPPLVERATSLSAEAPAS